MEQSTNADECNTLDFRLAIFQIVLFSISLFGNSTAIFIFSRRKFSPARLLFLILAVLDILFLGSEFLFLAMPDLCRSVSGCEAYAQVNVYFYAYAFPFIVITYCVSTWVVVLMAWNRYLAITRPLEYHRITTIKYVYIQLFVVTTVCVLYNIPRFLEIDVGASNDSTSGSAYVVVETELHRNQNYQIFYKIVSFLILMICLPVSLLTFFTYKLIREIRRSYARRSMMQGALRHRNSNTTNEELSITITLVTVVIAFIIFHVPIGINRFIQLWFIHKYDSISCIIINNSLFYLAKILNTFADINATINWIIYGIASPQFRRDLRTLCKCDFTTNQASISNPNTPTSRRAMTLETLDINTTPNHFRNGISTVDNFADIHADRVSSLW